MKQFFLLFLFILFYKITYSQKQQKGVVKFAMIQYEELDSSTLQKVQSDQTFGKLLNELPDDTQFIDSSDVSNLKDLFLRNDKRITRPLFFRNIQFNNEKQTIWLKDFSYDGNLLDFARILSDGRKQYYKHMEPPRFLSEEELFSHDYLYEIQIDSTDTKKILNFDCFKVKMVEKIIDFNNLDAKHPETIYEMYAVDNLKLPLHSFLPVKKLFDDFFPLEIKYYKDNSKLINYIKINSIN